MFFLKIIYLLEQVVSSMDEKKTILKQKIWSSVELNVHKTTITYIITSRLGVTFHKSLPISKHKNCGKSF